MTTKTELITRKQELELNRLEIKRDLADAKLSYVIDGVQLPWNVKASLEAELSHIALESAIIDRKIKGMNVSYAAGKIERFNIQIRRVLKARGMGYIIEEVEREVERDEQA